MRLILEQRKKIHLKLLPLLQRDNYYADLSNFIIYLATFFLTIYE